MNSFTCLIPSVIMMDAVVVENEAQVPFNHHPQDRLTRFIGIVASAQANMHCITTRALFE
jgi:hypothetical protein